MNSLRVSLAMLAAAGGWLALSGCADHPPETENSLVRVEVAPLLPATWEALATAAADRRAPIELWKQREALAQRARGAVPLPNAAETALTIAELLESCPAVLKLRQERQIRTELLLTALEWRFQARRCGELRLLLKNWQSDDRNLQVRLTVEFRQAEQRREQAAIQLRRLTGCPPGTGDPEALTGLLPEIDWSARVPDYSVIQNWAWNRRCELNIADRNLRGAASELARIPTGEHFPRLNFLNLPRRLLVKRAAQPGFDWQYAALTGAAAGCLSEIRTAYDHYLDQAAQAVQAEAGLRHNPNEFARLNFQEAEHQRRLRLAELWAASGADPARADTLPVAAGAVTEPAVRTTPEQKLAAAWVAEVLTEK